MASRREIRIVRRQERSVPHPGGVGHPLSPQSSVLSTGVRSAIILPVVLLILALLGLLAVSFSFVSNADYAATQAVADRMQTRLAAEAGFQFAALLLRQNREDVNAWYDNPQMLRGVLVWSTTATATEYGKAPETDAEESTIPAYRFSLVADDPNDDLIKVRYGLTDESAKININTAPVDQLRRLFQQVVPAEIAIDPLVDSLIDWRDEDDDAGAAGAESSYYRQLPTPYRCKNAPFDTVEELLMVKGFTGQILYGEDADRNGLLGLNEDDAEVSFPPDNGDGVLVRGLYPYLTMYSRDFNTANDRKPRIPLTGNVAEQREKLEEHFEPHEVEYLTARAANAGSNGLESFTAFLEPATTNGPPSPFGIDDLPRLVDRCTLDPIPELHGLININTAPPVVLRCLEALSEADVAAIVQKRAQLASDAKSTTAWLLTQGLVDPEKYDAVSTFICARGLQFTSEIVGYADHVGTRTRLQVVFEMRGPMPQILYYRDITSLGVNYPLRRADEEKAAQRPAQASRA